MTKLTILGKVPSKKNSRVTTRSGRTFPNKTYVEWEKSAIKQIEAQGWVRPETYPVRLECYFYMPDMVGRDMDNMLSSVLDVLKDEKKRKDGSMVIVRHSVLQDDSWKHINPIHLVAKLDKSNPRVEIFINE